MKKQTLTINVNTTLKYLQIWNGIFKLTSKELQILSAFINSPVVASFSVEGKKSVSELLNLKDFNTLNNYIKKFKDKGVISKKDDKYALHPLLTGDLEQVTLNLKK
jgi:hypothetical protein